MPQRENWLPTECLELAVIELRVHGHRELADEIVERGLGWYRARTHEEAAELTGRTPHVIKWNHAAWLYWAGHYAEARQLYEQNLEEQPDYWPYLGGLAVVAAQMGDESEALRIDQLLSTDDVYLVRSSTRYRAAIAAQLGHRDRALALVRESLAKGSWTLDFHLNLEMEPLWDDPAFQQLLEPKG
jgi:tetratricopeptide (TPR) repeat protein